MDGPRIMSMMMPLSELMAGQERRPEQPAIDPDAAIARLREAGERYEKQLRGSPIQVGDLVTCVPDAPMLPSGFPMLVVDIRDPKSIWLGDNIPMLGYKPDIRVMYVQDGNIIPAWIESWCVVPWATPTK